MIICSLIFLFDVYPGASLYTSQMINENYPKNPTIFKYYVQELNLCRVF